MSSEAEYQHKCMIARLMRGMPFDQRNAAIDAAPNVIDARDLFAARANGRAIA